MNSEKFMLQSSLEANYLNIQPDNPVKLDEIAIKVIKNDCPDFIIPFRITDINEQVIIKYKLLNATALEYAEISVSKQEFIKMYLKLLAPFISGRDWFLNYHNLCVDTRYVFLDRHFNNAYFIYVPEESFTSSDEEITAFFNKVLTRAEIRDDDGFQVKLFRYFAGGQVTLDGLYRMFKEEESRGGMAVRSGSMNSAGSMQQGNAQYNGQALQPGMRQSGAAVQPNGMNNTGGAQQPGAVGEYAKNQAQSAAPSKEKPAKSSLFANPFAKPAASKSAVQQAQPVQSVQPVNQVPPMQGMPSQKDNILSDNDLAIDALFDSGKKSSKKKAASAQTNKPQEKHGLFGSKKDKETKKGMPAPEAGNAFGQNGSGQNGFMQNAAGAPSSIAPNAMPQNAMMQNIPGQNNGMQFQISNVQSSMPQADDETEIAFDGPGQQGISPYLELTESDEPGAVRRIELNFQTPYITIGRISSDEVRPDVAFPANFKRIGRRHARIEKRDGSYYVIDLGSANHTLLNNQILIPNQPYLLQNGMELAFTVNHPVRYIVRL